MAVAMRDRWTDERPDDLNGKVGDGFRRMDQRFAEADQRFDRLEERLDRRFDAIENRFTAMENRFTAVERRFDASDRRFEAMNRHFDQRFDSLMTSMLHAWIIFGAAMISGFVALAVASL